MSVSVHGSGSIIGIDQGIQISGISTFQEGIDVTGGSVGIGTDNPRYPLEVNSGNLLVSGSAAGNLILEDRGVGDSSRPFALLASNGGNFTITNANRNASGTTTSSVERLRITSAGRLLLPTGSPGIQFGSPDDPALSGGIDISSQTLDDYEEGIWSAVLNYHTDNTNTDGYESGGTNGTINPNEATYTKIGRMVYVTCTFAVSSTANYVYKSITGLPFTAASRSNLKIYIRGGVYRYNTNVHEDAYFTGIIVATGNNINLNSERTDMTSSGWIQARTASQALSVSGCYLAS